MSTLANRKAQSAAFAWPKVGESGTVPIDSIVPNPRNPRKYFDKDETSEMAASIKKGGQREIATVRLLTREDGYPDSFRYMITSGERRWRGAHEDGQETYDIRVKRYVSRGQERLDMVMLNEDRKSVSDLELAWSYRDLMEENDWNQTELAQHINRDIVWVSDRIMILRCTDKVQDRLHPKHKSKMLNLQVGMFYSKLRPDLQDDLIDSMPAHLETAKAQLAWLEKQINLRGLDIPRRTRQPKTYRRILQLFTAVAKEKADMTLAPEFARLFENTSDEQANKIASDLREALCELEKLVARVEELAKGQKKQTMLFPRQQMSTPPKREVSAPPSLPPKRTIVVKKQSALPLRSQPAGLTLFRSSTSEETKKSVSAQPKPIETEEVWVRYRHEHSGRPTGKSVTPKEYRELKAKGLLLP